MAEKVEIKFYKIDNITQATTKNALFAVKGTNESTFKLYVTDLDGNPIPLYSSGSAGSINLTSTDSSILITGGTTKDLKLSTTLKNLITSALQSGDPISELLNDAGYLTIADLPVFNPIDYDLSEFTNTGVDPYVKQSEIIASSGIISISQGDNVVVDDTDPQNPTISVPTVPYSDLTGVPTSFTPSTHTHTESQITDLDKYTQAETDNLLSNKVDKIVGKGLSTEDYTTTEKTKLSGIEAGAEVNNISDFNATDLTDGGSTTLHNHDTRYYTETEVDTFLGNKFDTPTGDNTQYLDGAGTPTTFPTIPDVSSFIPYTGATQNVNLGSNSLSASNISGTNTGDNAVNSNSNSYTDTKFATKIVKSVITLQHTAQTLSDGANYFFGRIASTPATSSSLSRRGASPLTGKIKKIIVYTFSATPTSAQDVVLKLNNKTTATQTTVGNIRYDNSTFFYSFDVDITVTRYDSLEIELNVPVLTTNGTGSVTSVELFFEE